MIRTDGRPTIAWAPLPPPIVGNDPGDEHREQIPGQTTVEEIIEEIEQSWPPAEPIYGGF